MVYYPNKVNYGLIEVDSVGDGYESILRWYKAYPSLKTNKIAYAIYYSTDKETVFSEGIKFFAPGTVTTATIQDLIPGQLYFFGLRAYEYDPNVVDITSLAMYNGLYVPSYSLLRANITDTDLTIPLMDTTGYPNSGIVSIGGELIGYSSVSSNDLNLTALAQRGLYGTVDGYHHVDGYDLNVYWQPPGASFQLGGNSDGNTKIYACQSRFDLDHSSYTALDGYKQTTVDLLNTDLSAIDAFNADFPHFDQSGWRRTDMEELLKGNCVGSYIGGTYYCVDSNTGVGQRLKGMSVNSIMLQKEEYLLTLTGEPICLLQRQQTGIICDCYLPSNESFQDRCPRCYGTKYVIGFNQFFNQRRSDGRIMCRFSAGSEDLKRREEGIESEFTTEVWTLAYPTIKDRDILVRFDINDNVEFFYEVMNVNRARTVLRLEGAQKMQVQRIRKYDPAYNIKFIKNTATMPRQIATSQSSGVGIPLHFHTVTVSENITQLSQITQTTSISNAHSHEVINGIVRPSVNGNHSHVIIFP